MAYIEWKFLLRRFALLCSRLTYAFSYCVSCFEFDCFCAYCPREKNRFRVLDLDRPRALPTHRLEKANSRHTPRSAPFQLVASLFFDRPLDEDITVYCVHGLQYLPQLHRLSWERILELGRKQSVADMTRQRVQYSQDIRYQWRLLAPSWYTKFQPRRREAHSFHSQTQHKPNLSFARA